MKEVPRFQSPSANSIFLGNFSDWSFYLAKKPDIGDDFYAIERVSALQCEGFMSAKDLATYGTPTNQGTLLTAYLQAFQNAKPFLHLI
jgi:hypothetical protein